MESCERVRAATKVLLDHWEDEDPVDAAELAAVRSHIKDCEQCRRAVGAHVGLLQIRDLGSPDGEHRRHTAPDGLTNSVMKRIAAEPRPRPSFATVVKAAGVVVVIGLAVFAATRGLLKRPRNELVAVHFTLEAPGAASVTLVGDFSDWDPSAIAMKDADGDGTWEARLRLKPGGAYLYNFVIDGELWVVDPSADGYVDDGFGSRNSLLQL